MYACRGKRHVNNLTKRKPSQKAEKRVKTKLGTMNTYSYKQ